MRTIPLCAFITASMLPLCAQPLQTPDSPLSPPPQAVTLERSLVSAARTQRDIFDESDNIASISGQALKKLNINNSKDLSQVFSGLYITNAGGSAYPSITLRGMRSGYYYSPNVRLYIDGVPQDIFFINQEMLDVDSVELFKGMSGTLYGENASAGLIIINSNIATNTTTASANVEFGNLTQGISASASGAIIPHRLYAKASFKHSTYLGQIRPSDSKLAPSGGNADTSSSNLARFSLLYDDSLWYVDADYYVDKSSFHDMVYLSDSELGDKHHITHNYGTNGIPSIERSVATYALKGGFDTGEYSLSNVLSLQDRDMPITNFGSTWNEKNKQISNELKLSKTYANGSRSLVGAYVSYGDYSHHFTNDSKRQDDTNRLKTLHLALFTDHTLALPSSFELSLGARYTHYVSEMNYRAGSGSESANIGDFSASLSNDELSPRLALSYALLDSHKLYASASRGFKAGGFPNFIYSAAYRRSYKPETNYTAEIGYKGLMLGDRIYVNADYFFTYSRHRQENILIDASTATAIIGNLGDMASHGVEFEGKYNVANQSFFMLNLAYINAKYHNATNALTGQSFDNREVFFLPAFNLNASLDMKLFRMLGANVFFNTLISHKSRIYFTDTYSQKPYTLWNLGLRAEIESLSIQLNVQNVLNTLYDTYGFGTAGAGYHQIAPLRNVSAVIAARF